MARSARSAAAGAGQLEAAGVSIAAYVVAAALYPLWHLAAPSDALDPWPAWWAVAGAFLLVALLGRLGWLSPPRVATGFALSSGLVTLHLYLLAHLNDMRAFYAVGSALAVATTALSMRTPRAVAAYGVYVALLATLLYRLRPDPAKIAYWGSMLTVVLFAYHRLSHRLAAEALARRYREELEARVRERTRELSEANGLLRREIDERLRLEQRLRAAGRMQAVGQLAGFVAHEFNNMLATIDVYTDLALGALPPDAPVRKDVEQIQRTTRQAEALTRQLLALSRREHSLDHVLDLGQLVRDLEPAVRRLVGDDIQLALRVTPDPLPVRTSAGFLDQVVVNLVLNARDAMPDGGTLVIECRRAQAETPGDADLALRLDREPHAVMTVTDSGIGMDEQTRARAFDPFFTTKPVGSGTGLGLSIIHNVVRQHRGHVRLFSAPGAGTRFEIYLPLTDEPLSVATPGVETERSSNGRRILVAEDRAELRRALARMLADRGYRVLEAADGADALHVARLEALDLVVADVVMPRMTGPELVTELRKSRPDLKALLISAHPGHPEPGAPALPPGVEIVTKPFRPEDLLLRIRRLLSGETNAQA